jgi:UPF0042 nucleotide-binding protein
MSRRATRDTSPVAGNGRGPSHLVDFVIISGLSGAGKSSAMNVFEDAGYFCVDNLPAEMIRSLAELFRHPGSKVERAAVVSDSRAGEYLSALAGVIDELDEAGVVHRVLFLEADEQTLLSRYKETRRRHPLAPEGRIVEGIRAERELLAPLREGADLVMDTSDLTGAMLRRRIATEMLGPKGPSKLALTILTFGFKNGPPRDADMMFDVRFLPNPHYREDLRPLTGRDPKVVEHVEAGDLAGEFYQRLLPLLDFLLPAYIAEGKSHLTIAIGCTGGRHRSVAIADRVAQHLFGREDLVLRVVHRDVELD